MTPQEPQDTEVNPDTQLDDVDSVVSSDETTTSLSNEQSISLDVPDETSGVEIEPSTGSSTQQASAAADAAPITPEPAALPVVPVNMPEPTATGTGDSSPVITPLTPPKKSLKKLVLIIVAVFVGLLLLGGGIAFAVWNSSPQKILNDSLSQLLSTPPKSVDAAGEVTADDTKVKLATKIHTNGNDAQVNVAFTMTSGSTAVSVDVDAIAAQNGDLYIRLNDAQKMLTQFTQGSPEMAAMFKGIIAEVDTKWIKITSEDLGTLSSTEKSPSSECVSKAITAFQADSTQQNEVSDLYAQNQVVTVKEQKPDEVISGRNSYHFVLNFDQAKAQEFAKGLEQTKIYKDINECLGDTAQDSGTETTAASDTDATVDVWIDKSNRQLTKVGLQSTSTKENASINLSAILDYSTEDVTIPAKSMTVDTLLQEIQKSYLSPISTQDDVLGAFTQ